MRSRRLRWVFLILAAAAGRAVGADSTITELSVVTGVEQLDGPAARQQLLAVGRVGGLAVDLTRRVEWRSETPGVAAVGPDGVARAVGDGVGRIAATVGGRTARVALTVSGTTRPDRPTFERDVMPLLTRAGCNAGACHGKARGQNGFQLSLLGFDPESDFAAIAL